MKAARFEGERRRRRRIEDPDEAKSAMGAVRIPGKTSLSRGTAGRSGRTRSSGTHHRPATAPPAAPVDRFRVMGRRENPRREKRLLDQSVAPSSGPGYAKRPQFMQTKRPGVVSEDLERDANLDETETRFAST
jgi:hypothetical protein